MDDHEGDGLVITLAQAGEQARIQGGLVAGHNLDVIKTADWVFDLRAEGVSAAAT
jgi:excinuclease UvrABC ATPase subunit